MEHQLSLHLKSFNRRVQVMNQTNSKELVLTCAEARNIQSELFVLLAHMVDLTDIKTATNTAEVVVDMNGGDF
jgi:hypothetical protein